MTRFTKIDATGAELPDDATEWSAVLDSTTGLMWSAENIGTERVDWAKAKQLASETKLCGLDGWRLPDIKELFSLTNHSRFDPAIDVAYFPTCKPNWYWSSSPFAALPESFAWGVLFSGGNAFWNDQSNDGFVRAVRSVVSVPGQ